MSEAQVVNAYTLEGINPGRESFLKAIVNNSAVVTAVQKKMAAKEIEEILVLPENHALLYVVSLQATGALDRTISAAGVRTVEGFSELQHGAGQFLDVDFRTEILARGPQVDGDRILSISAEDLATPEWQKYLAKHAPAMAKGLSYMVGGIVSEISQYPQIIAEEKQQNNGVSELQEGLLHMLQGGHSANLGRLCSDIGTPSNIMLTSRIYNLRAELKEQITH